LDEKKRFSRVFRDFNELEGIHSPLKIKEVEGGHIRKTLKSPGGVDVGVAFPKTTKPWKTLEVCREAGTVPLKRNTGMRKQKIATLPLSGEEETLTVGGTE